MKPGRLTLAIFLVWFFSTVPAFPQAPGGKPGPGMRHRGEDLRCGRAAELNLSPEQLKELEQIQQSLVKETQILRAQLFAKRLELRETLTNPTAKTELIRLKYGEVASLESKIEEKSVDFLVKLRSLLTPEQMRYWCPEREFLPLRGGMGHGPGMMDPRSRRTPPQRDVE
jgi:Spy/CpxP family protein refolding chaperone